MDIGIVSEHWSDANGYPAGGSTFGSGFAISWQNGPRGRGEDRKKPNGAFVEDVLKAVVDRLRYYQSRPAACEYNEAAIEDIESALAELEERTKNREVRGVEGTYQK